MLGVTKCALAGALAARVAASGAATGDQASIESLREAGALCEGAYSVLSRAPGSTPSDLARLRQAAERGARVYEVWDVIEPGAGHAETASEWRKRMRMDP
jgi:hypothetical protein